MSKNTRRAQDPQQQANQRRNRIAAALAPTMTAPESPGSVNGRLGVDDLLDLTEEQLIAEYQKSPAYLQTQMASPPATNVAPSAPGTSVPQNAPGALPAEKLRGTASWPTSSDPVEKAKAEAIATFALKSSVNSAAVVEKFAANLFPGLELGTLQQELSACLRKVAGGNMAQAETMLMGQAIALQSIFLNMARRVPGQEYVSGMQNFLGMALKAQNQCRMTLETLNELKNPRQVAFVRTDQTNIAQNQQVNNRRTSRTRQKSKKRPNKLLEQSDGNRLDSAAAPVTELDDPAMAALEKIDGADNAGRQGNRRS